MRVREAIRLDRTDLDWDPVVGYTVIPATGETIQLNTSPRAAMGPDLRQVFIGSEGTLGVITSVTLKVGSRRRNSFRPTPCRASVLASDSFGSRPPWDCDLFCCISTTPTRRGTQWLTRVSRARFSSLGALELTGWPAPRWRLGILRRSGFLSTHRRMVATGVNNDGYREVLGVSVSTTRVRRRLADLLQRPVTRGVTGVALVTLNAHTGLVDAIGATFVRRLMATLPHPLHREPDEHVPQARLAGSEGVAARGVRTRRRQGRPRPARPAPRRGRPQPAFRRPRTPGNRPRRGLAFTAYPQGVWRQIWSINPN